MPEPAPSASASPELFFDTVNAYQKSAALKAAIELDLFTAIDAGHQSTAAIAQETHSSERGVRILSDYLTIAGFLTKQDGQYGVTADTAFFLSKRSPAYIGGSIEFLLSPMLSEVFQDLTSTVRKGGATFSPDGTLAPENPIWVKFARAMAPLTTISAQGLVKLAALDQTAEIKVLDIAAGHGMFGIAFAKRHPNARVTAVDWPNVLDVALENATAAGVRDRYATISGSAFDVEYGAGYDIVLLTNILHHFDPPTCEKLLRKVHAALNDSGRAITLEFVPNDDRITPPTAAAFSLTMLGSTPAGDAYTFAEYDRMFRNAGFRKTELNPLPPTFQHAMLSIK